MGVGWSCGWRGGTGLIGCSFSNGQQKNRRAKCLFALLRTSSFRSHLPSDPCASHKHEQPDRKEHGSRQFRDWSAWDRPIEFWIGCHVAPVRIVSPVVDACVDSRLVARAPPVAGCVHIIGLVVPELPLPAAARVVVVAVCDDVVAFDGVACAFTLQVEACVCVVMHPVAGDVVVVCVVEADAVVVVRVCGVARKHIIARTGQVDAEFAVVRAVVTVSMLLLLEADSQMPKWLPEQLFSDMLQCCLLPRRTPASPDTVAPVAVNPEMFT